MFGYDARHGRGQGIIDGLLTCLGNILAEDNGGSQFFNGLIRCRFLGVNTQAYQSRRAYHQNQVFDAAHSFSQAEGFIFAPETTHAVRAAYDEALKCKESGESKVILFNASGHGDFDLAAYDAYHRNELLDYSLEEAKINDALTRLPQIPE